MLKDGQRKERCINDELLTVKRIVIVFHGRGANHLSVTGVNVGGGSQNSNHMAKGVSQSNGCRLHPGDSVNRIKVKNFSPLSKSGIRKRTPGGGAFIYLGQSIRTIATAICNAHTEYSTRYHIYISRQRYASLHHT